MRVYLFSVLKLMQLSLENHFNLIQISALLREELLELIAILDELLNLAVVELDSLLTGLDRRKSRQFAFSELVNIVLERKLTYVDRNDESERTFSAKKPAPMSTLKRSTFFNFPGT